MIFPKGHPAIPFLLLLAIADDALGLILLALFYPTGPVSLVAFAALMAPALGVGFLLKRRGVRNFWAYTVLAGGLSWAALYYGGIHPALALVPIIQPPLIRMLTTKKERAVKMPPVSGKVSRGALITFPIR